MALVKFSEASRLVGKSEKTLYRHVSQKRLSVTLDENGQKVIDTSELMRVYGILRNDERQNVQSMPLSEKSFENEIQNLKAVNVAYKMILDEKDKRIELLTYTNQPKKSLTWVWVIVAVLISVLATNLAYRIPSPF
jgi:hypothetical protein